MLRVSAEHIYQVALGHTTLASPVGGASTKVDFEWRFSDWLLLRVCDLRALRARGDAAWTLRPETASRILMDLQLGGGLQKVRYANEGALAAAVVRAAAAIPRITLAATDILPLPKLTEGKWLPEISLDALLPGDGCQARHAGDSQAGAQDARRRGGDLRC